MEMTMSRFVNILRSKGYKLTNQRKAILKTIVDNHDEHLSCDEVFLLVSKDNPDMGIATVYRTLQLFEKLKIVYRLNFDDGFSRYELASTTGGHHHHHVICLGCGKVIEVKLDLLDSLESQIEKENQFTIVDHNLKFYGYCKDCR